MCSVAPRHYELKKSALLNDLGYNGFLQELPQSADYKTQDSFSWDFHCTFSTVCKTVFAKETSRQEGKAVHNSFKNILDDEELDDWKSRIPLN